MTPPIAKLGAQRIPLVGIYFRLRDIIIRPSELVYGCQRNYGNVFTIRVPFNFDLTYLMTEQGFDYVTHLPSDVARMAGVMFNVPAIGSWLPRSDPREPHLQALLLAGRTFIGRRILEPDRIEEAVAGLDSLIDQHLTSWNGELNLAHRLPAMIHDACGRSVLGEDLWGRMRNEAIPALRDLADGIDIPRATLAKTPYRYFMPEYRATFALQRLFRRVLADQHGAAGDSLLDEIRAIDVGGGGLDETDSVWMLLYILWNALTYPGAYGLWCLLDIVSHREVLEELRRRNAEERAKLLSHCISETIRLSPITSLPRVLAEDVEYEEDGVRYRIAAGSYIATGMHVTSRDPQRFKKPSRWDPLRYEHGESVPPLFGQGPYGCVAQNFVRKLLVKSLDSVLQRFDIALTNEPPARKTRVHLTYPKVAIGVTLTRRTAD